MKEQELLDNGFDDENTNLLSAVEWWEKRRLVYNVLLFGVELLAMIIYWNGTLVYGVGLAIFMTILTNVFANMFYTIGWGLEILFLYYFKIKPFIHGVRFTLYLMGVVFSLLWAWSAYSLTLSGW